jgi:hypothetical protein
MNYTRNIISTLPKRLMLACVVFVLLLSYFNGYAQAADLTNRTVILSSSFPSEVVNHSFTFTTITPSNIGSIQFEYCSNSPLFVDPCTPPAGLNVATAGIFTQSGMTGFSVSGASNANTLILTRAPVVEVPVAASYVFSNITNPSTPNQIVYVRISTFDNINATGATIDTGAVVFVVDDRFDITAFVPPYMTFCVAVNVALNCSSTSGFLGDFGEFNENAPVATTTQFAVATNDPLGYNTYLGGQTMTSGTNVIPGLAVQTFSAPGTSQFGINLRQNGSPSIGADVEGVGTGTPAPNYNAVNQFRFVDGERIAGSALSTDFNRYTISYIVNVSENQAPGVYATTITYTSIANF